jgi:hypothetical protein
MPRLVYYSFSHKAAAEAHTQRQRRRTRSGSARALTLRSALGDVFRTGLTECAVAARGPEAFGAQFTGCLIIVDPEARRAHCSGVKRRKTQAVTSCQATTTVAQYVWPHVRVAVF